MSRYARILAGIALPGVLAACSGQSTPPLYSWQNFQAQQYLYLQGKTDPLAQITVMEKDMEKARAKGLSVPPGFHAHLGLLYAAEGKTDLAQQEFTQEKTLFPEATTYMDFLLKNLGQAPGSSSNSPQTQNVSAPQNTKVSS
ncbi:DUF4810 domain-containing protein [Asaia sp. W19]|uniref:DUF4810 domain-containing protein n=1 Tax=unclassified Asaia TaxID=2685023 RepID=UPI000F8F7402|nr:DUF4810 domain-containing protein [Asaia sp. W19]RUT26276.1 DUF4810 domain-containing protein [Asaia sp. W19]RUT27633.1 DUF4810 domain-containing protein [Asaia sp. W19]